MRCSDGVVLASDTMVMTGSSVKHRNVRRLHKVRTGSYDVISIL